MEMEKERENVVDRILKPDPQVMKGLRKHLKILTPFLKELFNQERPLDCEGTPRIRIVVAPPKSFKTTFCFWLAKEQALRDANYTGLYISADDRRERLEAWVHEYGLKGRLSTRRLSNPVGLHAILELPQSYIYIDSLSIIVDFHTLLSLRNPTARYYLLTLLLSYLIARLEAKGKHLTLTYHSSVKQKVDLKEDPRLVLSMLYGDTTGLVAGASEIIGIQREGDDRLWTFRISKEGEGRNLYRIVSSQSGVPLLEEIDWKQEMITRLSQEMAQVLLYLREHKKVKKKNLAEALGLPDDTVRKRLQRLRNKGYVIYDPADSKWSLTPSGYEIAESIIVKGNDPTDHTWLSTLCTTKPYPILSHTQKDEQNQEVAELNGCPRGVSQECPMSQDVPWDTGRTGGMSHVKASSDGGFRGAGTGGTEYTKVLVLEEDFEVEEQQP